MTLENITGTLLAYKELEPGSFQHSDQLTTERRTNNGLRNHTFYTADGSLYTVQENRILWAITREPQTLVLQNIDEAYRQLTRQGDYFPEAEAGRASLEHEDTVVVDLEGLELKKFKFSDRHYGRLDIDPKNIKKLNFEQRKAARRIYGPDEENFGLNMEMFAEAGNSLPQVFVLAPEYVQHKLIRDDPFTDSIIYGREFLMRASCLSDFFFCSNFGADDRIVGNHSALRGVRRVITEASR